MDYSLDFQHSSFHSTRLHPGIAHGFLSLQQWWKCLPQLNRLHGSSNIRADQGASIKLGKPLCRQMWWCLLRQQKLPCQKCESVNIRSVSMRRTYQCDNYKPFAANTQYCRQMIGPQCLPLLRRSRMINRKRAPIRTPINHNHSSSNNDIAK